MKNTKEAAIPVGWARLGPGSMFLAGLFKVSKPPILVLSLPRSGSSWVGEIFGSSANALYLREPITQSNLALDETQPAEIYIDPVEPQPVYQGFADTAFNGIPAFGRDIVVKPRQWSLLERKRRRLVIKEVNPLACEWILKRYRPKVVFLVRHPVAVALSYLKLGWMNLDLKKMLFSDPRLTDGPLKEWKNYLSAGKSDSWENHGAMQGAVLRFALDSLSGYSDRRIILYEDLCSRPVEIFRELFGFTDLCWDGKTEKLIIEQSSGGDTSQPYSVSRDSKKMINAWKGKLSEEELKRLKDAYLAFDLPWYRSSRDW